MKFIGIFLISLCSLVASKAICQSSSKACSRSCVNGKCETKCAQDNSETCDRMAESADKLMRKLKFNESSLIEDSKLEIEDSNLGIENEGL